MAKFSSSILHTLLAAALIAEVISVQQHVRIPKTRFSCEGRPSGYYADLDTGCQVYHMCDGLGRQFSYSCPNTTLFQQRMLICDHWYMVNCSLSERDYSANLLIGQRDKPFVSDAEDHQRTPRPDILSAAYAQGFNNYGGFQEQIPSGSGKVALDDSVSNGNNELNDGVQRFAIPTHWSTELTNYNRFTTAAPVRVNKGFTGKPIIIEESDEETIITSNSNGLISQSTDNIVTRAPAFDSNTGRTPIKTQVRNQQTVRNEKTTQKFQPRFFTSTESIRSFENTAGVPPPSKFLNPPLFEVDPPVTDPQTLLKSTTVKSIASFNNELLSDFLPPLSSESSEESQPVDVKKIEDAVFNFIKRFNSDEVVPKSSEEINPVAIDFTTGAGTTGNGRTGFEIQSSSETAGFVTQPAVSNLIPLNQQKTSQSTTVPKQSTFSTGRPNQVSTTTNQQNTLENNVNTANDVAIPTLSRELLPPDTEYSDIGSSTMGPIIYYEWKWAAPAQELEPPFAENETEKDKVKRGQKDTAIEGRPDFAKPRSSTVKPVTQITAKSTTDQTTSEGSTDYKVSPYFIPDYVFPLDKQHPGYSEDGAITSFQVKIPQSVNEAHPYYGENAQCPQCHPSFVVPGTCKPCVMIRR